MDLRNFDPAWDLRTEVVAHLIPKGSRISDSGREHNAWHLAWTLRAHIFRLICFRAVPIPSFLI